ncbi:MAG TPA: acyl carrier protein [Bacillota bacterium]|nr:acyl carrier protein [Bacillota bacterium]HPF42707.1 acyl carrier protein [Bacillota bacterium]HPJ86311.1 acyl carrier protein [Bacillota bacterium]HPQ62332.1 acyl carrier protein [Bacillota bacterium]HRX92086.1 acyl carrier protein [Candidatus Izemoplasmatales bacterium]
MDKKQVVFEKIKEIIIQELGVKPEKVVMDAGLADDFGADSLDALELFNQIESEFLITISDEAAMKMKDVSDLVEYVVEHVSDKYFG